VTNSNTQLLSAKNTAGLTALTVALICFMIYLPALTCGYVNFDDPEYFIENINIRSLDGNLIYAAFAQSLAGFWLPLTLISYAVDYHFWGLNPVGFHLTNNFLHSLNAALVVLIADALFKTRTTYFSSQKNIYFCLLAFAGLSFGIHPLRVESVAWITERKDVLNGAFAFASTLFYIRYATSKQNEKKGASTLYLLSLLLFIASLMAKSISVVLPVMFLIIDWWPLNRLSTEKYSSLFVEKIPFFIFSTAMSILTIYIAQQEAFLTDSDIFPMYSRIVVSGYSIYEYCKLVLFPLEISPVYKLTFPVAQIYLLKTIVILIVSCICVLNFKKRPWLLTTWLLFIVPLVPTLAFFQCSMLTHAARYSYIPSLGLSIACPFLAYATYLKISASHRHARMKYFIVFLVTFLLVSYGGLSVIRIGDWKDSEAMWTRVIGHQQFSKAYWFRGSARLESGRYQAAIEDFSAGLNIITKEDTPDLHNFFAYLGYSRLKAHQYQAAIVDLSTAISMFPHPVYYLHRGEAYQALGQSLAAQQNFATAGAAPGKLNWFAAY
jgi:hypothetical protein